MTSPPVKLLLELKLAFRFAPVVPVRFAVAVVPVRPAVPVVPVIPEVPVVPVRPVLDAVPVLIPVVRVLPPVVLPDPLEPNVGAPKPPGPTVVEGEFP